MAEMLHIFYGICQVGPCAGRRTPPARSDEIWMPQMMLRMLKKAVSEVKAHCACLCPFSGPPLDYGLSLLSKRACQARKLGTSTTNPHDHSAVLYCRLGTEQTILGEHKMNEVVMLEGPKTTEILQTAVDKGISVIMSYLSKNKWHVAKLVLTDLNQGSLAARTVNEYKKQHPLNVRVGQPVGMSFKYEYGKFVFDTTIVALAPSTDPHGGGAIIFETPRQIEVIQRRSYFRVNVPNSLKVKVTLWHRKGKSTHDEPLPGSQAEAGPYCQGTLVDISAGGAQVMLDSNLPAGRPFRKGQFIAMRFTPLPYERPIVLNAQIRNALPRADGRTIFLGLQIVGLEASPEGRKTLNRLVGIVERYYHMNQASSAPEESVAVPAPA